MARADLFGINTVVVNDLSFPTGSVPPSVDPGLGAVVIRLVGVRPAPGEHTQLVRVYTFDRQSLFDMVDMVRLLRRNSVATDPDITTRHLVTDPDRNDFAAKPDYMRPFALAPQYDVVVMPPLPHRVLFNEATPDAAGATAVTCLTPHGLSELVRGHELGEAFAARWWSHESGLLMNYTQFKSTYLPECIRRTGLGTEILHQANHFKANRDVGVHEFVKSIGVLFAAGGERRCGVLYAQYLLCAELFRVYTGINALISGVPRSVLDLGKIAVP